MSDLENIFGDMGKIASKMLQLGATTTNKEVQGEVQPMEVDTFPTTVKVQQDGLMLDDEERIFTHEKKKIKLMLDGEKTQVFVVPRRNRRRYSREYHRQQTEGQEEEEESSHHYLHKRNNSLSTSPASNSTAFQFQIEDPNKCDVECGDVCITEEDTVSCGPVPELPSEILNSIFEYVKLEDRCMASMVSKHWMNSAWLRVTNMEFNLRHRPDQESIILRTLQKCANVRNVTLRDCYNVSGRVLRQLPASVQSFEFFNCCSLTKSTTNDDVKYLPRDMTKLSLKNCENIADDAVAFLPASLKFLDLSGSKVCDVSKVPRGLKFLVLARSQLPFKTLAGLPDTLVTLDLSQCALELGALDCLPSSICTLNLSGCSTLTDQHLAQLALLSELKALFLEGSPSITSKGIEELPASLQVLSIKHCAGINDRAVLSIPRNLKEFSLWKCKSVTKSGLIRLPSTLVALKLVHTAINDEIVGMLPSNLNRLSLFGCQQVTDAGLQLLPQSVMDLDISWTSITDKGLRGMVDRLPYLNKVNLSNTKISREGIIILENNKPGLSIAKGPRFCD